MFILIYLVLCFVIGIYAGSKGRSGVGIFLLSFFLSPLVGLVVALAMRPNDKKAATTQGKKQCPECAEYIQPEARTCRFCQHKYTEAEQLAAVGMSAGPPCPKCGSVSTFSCTETTKAKASHWWKVVRVSFLRCRKCNERWQSKNPTSSENLRGGTLGILFLGLCIILLYVWVGHSLQNRLPQISDKNPSEKVDSLGRSVPQGVSDDVGLLISRCGKPSLDDSTAYDHPRPPIVTRWVEYRKQNVHVVFVADAPLNTPPPYRWKFMGIQSIRSPKKALSVDEAVAMLPCWKGK